MSLTIDPVNNPALTAKVLPSPRRIRLKSGKGERELNFSGTLYAATPAAAHTLRDALVAIVNDNQRVTISYSGESGYNGTYYIESATVDSVKIGSGHYEYDIDAVYVGA